VAEDNMEKFAEHLLATGRVEMDAQALDVATALANVVGAAWGYEGRGVERAGAAADETRDADEVIAELAAELATLTDAAATALKMLEEL